MIRPRLKLLSYRNQLIDLLYNLIYRFLYHGNIGCHCINSIIFFLNIESGKVSAEYYGNIAFMKVEDLRDRADFELKDPTQIGVLDNMVSAIYNVLRYGYRMAGFFVAPMSGNNIFTVACGENCKVYFSHGPNINHTNSKIIELKKITCRFKFDQ